MSTYPRDDFDAVAPPRDGRRGAHRAAPRRSSRLVAPLVVAAVVAVAGGVGWVAVSATGGNTAAASAATDPAADPAASPAGDAAADPAADAADAAADPAADAADAADETAVDIPAAPDLSVPVVVLNGTGTKGLAASTAATLGAAGWTVSGTGNASSAQRSEHEGTTVLYPVADLEVTAAALATAAGGAAVLDPDATASTLTVVLLP